MIYADHNGSSPLCPNVVEHLANRIQNGPFANPNAIHCLGQTLLNGVEKCRRICAKNLGANRKQTIFNSGASEGISQVFHTLLSKPQSGKDTFIISSIEHSAVVNSAQYYKREGLNLLVLPVDDKGVVNLDILNDWLAEFGEKILMISIMAANNETGIIQPIDKIAKLAAKNDIPFFSDTTQYIGKREFNFSELGLDFAVLSGHKIGALVGSGILLAKNPETLKPLIFGGGQEQGHRGGTQNYIGIETLALALDSLEEKSREKIQLLKSARENFEKIIQEEFPETIIVGKDSDRLAGTTLISYPGIHGQAIQIELESNDIFVTTSSACSDNEPNTSRILRAMNISDDVGRGVIRISLCSHNASEYYEKIYQALKSSYLKLLRIKSY